MLVALGRKKMRSDDGSVFHKAGVENAKAICNIVKERGIFQARTPEGKGRDH